MHDVSILLLTRNGDATLPRLFDALAAQDYPGATELVAVDSGSTDGTLPFLRPRVSRVLSIDPASFNHGETRNAGIDATTAPLVVLIAQDAVPSGPRWLRELTAPFAADERIAAAWSRQVALPGASAMARAHLERWVGASREPRIASLAGSAFQNLSPLEQFEMCAFDNVCSCIRRSVWARRPFPKVPIGEDIEWARGVLLDGYRIVYVATSVVQHSHERTARYEFMRTLLVHYRLRQIFGLSTVPGLVALARSTASSLRAHASWLRADRSRRHGAAEWGRALALGVAWPLGQYAGARLADWRIQVRGFRGI